MRWGEPAGVLREIYGMGEPSRVWVPRGWPECDGGRPYGAFRGSGGIGVLQGTQQGLGTLGCPEENGWWGSLGDPMGFGVLEGPCRVWGPWVCRAGVYACGSVRLGAPAGSGSPYGVGGPCRVSGPWRILLALGATKGDLLPAALKGSRFRAAAAGQGPFPTDALEVSGRTMGGPSLAPQLGCRFSA